MTGSTANCNVACAHQEITSCANDDECCPAGCVQATDNDCPSNCGNDVIELGETCDPPSSCPTTCDDGNPCTIDSMTGNKVNCNAKCNHQEITQCSHNDGCCPAGCKDAKPPDNDCKQNESD
jgi:hypothetical protein